MWWTGLVTYLANSYLFVCPFICYLYVWLDLQAMLRNNYGEEEFKSNKYILRYILNFKL
jgi:hypothetical protein